ncbi:MAG TPA: bifunctional DNA-formamidopyrimidine glycosylase/DNA-(apurinic or apyrimidinic site) lyase [Gemmatimonadaceae bacterium]|nr:bifunctional DNA-formamidopyrimidine glycosylase/DNA-(apurinic or apyrimidinic site) lyase [Gemmatimonadaceae bacterium]
MPELPETETIARDLDASVRGHTIVGVTVTRPDVLRHVTPQQLADRIAGARIERCWRRAKLVVLDLSTGDRLVVQPRFTGALLLDAGQLPERERAYSTLALTLDDGRRLHYRDIRRLGTVALMSPERFQAYTDRLGPEPLDPHFTDDQLAGLLRSSRQAVKKVLMDQRRVVGVGNIYANEALWRAGIDPSRPARSVSEAEAARLHAAIRAVLAESIAERGTSFRDYVDASGSAGRFTARLQAYGRGGAPCTRCGDPLAESHAIDGRTTVWCPRCQT